jgi:hypothetical protein
MEEVFFEVFSNNQKENQGGGEREVLLTIKK